MTADVNRLTSCRLFWDADFPSAEKLGPDQHALIRAFNAGLKDGSVVVEEVPCLCGGNDFDAVADYDRYRIRQRTVICRKCGLIQSMPRMDAEQTAKFYQSDLYRRLYDPDLLAIDRAGFDRQVAKVAHRHAFVTKALGGRRPKKVLEIGCGGGWNLFPYQQDGAQVIGYDHGPSLVAFGKSLGMDLRVGSIEDVAEDGFDLIILSHVMEHFLDPVEKLSQLAALLAKDGALYVEVPNADEFCIGALQNAHTYLFSPRTLAFYLAKVGLAQQVIGTFGPHVGGLFVRQSTPAAPDLSGEYRVMAALIGAHDRRERAKALLETLGLAGLIRGLRSRLCRTA